MQNEIEALVALGRLDEADEVDCFVEEKGQPTHAPGTRPIARAWPGARRVGARRRRRGACAARSSPRRARRLPQPFELGRTLLAQGSIERRAKRRGEARAALTRALEVFDQLGAPLWAEKAAQELARIPGRAPAAGELSETERGSPSSSLRGLEQGVAAKLFVTVRTVEGNLTRIYSKLGVRSRTELASRLAREQTS